MPDSMMVVHTKTSNRFSQKSRTTCSSVPSSIWPWATATRASGTRTRRPRRHGFDVLHPVVHEEGLAFTQQLPAQRLDHGGLFELAHIGEDRLARRRRCVDEREVADAGQCHLEGPGDGVGRQGQHVDTRRHLLHGLFVADAEALLLVHHEQAEVLELDVAGQHPVRAHHHVDRTRGEAGHDVARLGRGEKARQHLDPDGVPGVALGEGLGVLLGEQRGGDEHRRLLAVLDGLEHGPHRHLGLAEPDVAAHQPVHGHVGLHVALDLVDGAQLVDGLGEGEGVLELALPRACRARRRGPSCAAAAGRARRAPGRSRAPRRGPWPGCAATPTRPSRLSVGDSPPL